ncbi:MAG TPA: hypothetical protein VF856_11350 [Gemmatimonadaceae bacterium]
MRTAKFAAAVGASAFLLCVLASDSGAQERAKQRAPIIRIYDTNGSTALETTSYVTPVIEVAENAYVFAVSMDVDGQIQVLHPDFPGISVRMLAHKEIRLPNFFAGFAQQRGDGYSGASSYAGYSSYNDGYLDSRGTVIALASRAPFDLERIESGGDWNMSAIRRLIEYRTPQVAAQSLASYLGAKGEPIGRDILRFAGGRNYNSYYAYSPYSSCDLYGYAYAPTLARRFFEASQSIAFLRQRGQSARLGYDFCGFPIVIYTPRSFAGGFPVGRPRTRGDTTVFPKGRFPVEGVPHHPPRSSAQAAPEGVFPLTRSGLPQMGDVTITAPRGHRAEPGLNLRGYTSQPMSAPQGRAPIERVTTPRLEPAATGAQPVREYRPQPRTEAPPPARAPRESPPPPTPVVHERPSTSPPPAPPPRAATPTNPPPNRK